MGNHNSGRRPYPRAIHELRGNPSKKNLNENGVVPPAGDPVKPAGLTSGASAVWDQLAPVCMAMGTLTPADVWVFGTLCELQATMQATSAAKDGRQLFSLEREDPDDQEHRIVIVLDAILKQERDTANSLKHYYSLFGLEPVSRAKVQAPKKADAPASKWAGVLK